MKHFSRGLSTKEQWAAVLVHWLLGPATIWVVARPWFVELERRAGPLQDPATDLFTDGGMRFVAALGQTLEADAPLIWASLALGCVGYAVSFVVGAWLCVASARAEAGPDRTREPLGLLSALPRFGVLFLTTALFLGVLVFVAFVGVVVCEAVLRTPTDERTADLLTWGVGFLLLLPALLLQPISDLARVELVRAACSPFDALRLALRVTLYERRRLLGVWLACMLGAWTLTLTLTAYSQHVDPPGLLPSTLVLEQLGLLCLSCARSRWLSHAASAIYENSRHAR